MNRPEPAAVRVLPAGTSSGSGRRSSDPNSLPMTTLPTPRTTGRATSLHSSFSGTGMTSDPPPTYGSGSEAPARPDRRTLSSSFSPELARFASANRDVIGENLEARLQAAGYLPTDDPSRLTAEEWKNEYGVTKIELRRLQDLYSR
jgi:hypothetical protein